MKFKYRRFRDRTSPYRKFIKLPFIEVRLAYGSNHIDLDCLIDSGAGDCLFSADIADILGIDLENAEERKYIGIAEHSVVGRIHPVQMLVKGFSDWIEIEAAFLDINQLPLLGQRGFFDSYQITFEGYRGRFEVRSRFATKERHGNKYFM